MRKTQEQRHKAKPSWWVIALLVGALAASSSSFRRARAQSPAQAHKVVALGIDGMDPDLLRRFMDKGKLPHFATLAKMGDFRLLTTSIPPQSPVAWSNLITGLNPGEHGIFDFIHRDPATLLPYLSTSKIEAPERTLSMGSWVLPLSSGKARLLRHGKAFWEFLAERDIPATIFRIPANFPPVKSKARTFAGMGTPDMLGTYGTFSFYTDDPPYNADEIAGGRVYPVRVENSQVSAQLVGPPNTFKKGQPPATIDFTVWVDPVEAVAKITLQEREILLRVGEWSDWVPVKFELIPYLASVTGICRFYLKQTQPQFELYVSPINIDPSDPALPLSTPESYSRELWEEVGYFHTLGIAEDTKALSSGVLDEGEYLAQARVVLAEQLKIFEVEWRKFHSGFFFFYFSSLDQNAHMFWRAQDEHHPAYDPEVAARYSHVLEELYQEMDRVLGTVMESLDENTTLLVLSDHGFAPFHRSFNLNNWLLDNGYLTLKDDGQAGKANIFESVDWTRTRAYGLGLNGLYLNLRGRERDGMVEPGAEEEELADELARKLLQIKDPVRGLSVITRVDKARDAYTGPYVKDAPDLIVGYNRGYRAGWETILGQFSWEVLEDNLEPWSGDHCIDFRLVPGVLLSNKKIQATSPALTDLAPTILAEFGIDKPENMMGESVFGTAVTTNRLKNGSQ